MTMPTPRNYYIVGVNCAELMQEKKNIMLARDLRLQELFRKSN